MRSILALLVLSVAVAACGDASESAEPDASSASPAAETAPDATAEAALPEAPPPAPGTRPSSLFLRGLYIEPMYDGEAMLVEHEAIPGRMPAMQMPMRVLRPGLLDDLAVGTAIMMTVDSASLAVIAIEELPEGTVLDLDGLEGGDGGDIVLPE